MLRIMVVMALILVSVLPSYAAEMTVWGNRPTELIASFPDYPVPTDWVAVVKEAYAKADAMGYVVLYHVPVEYTMYLGVNPTAKTFTGTTQIRFISMCVGPKKFMEGTR